MSEIKEMAELVERWANINSHSDNFKGIELLISDVSKRFQILQPDEIRTIYFTKTLGLFLEKRATAPLQIYFGGHLDTVFSQDHPFQKARLIDENTLQGPGVTDMKGGIVVLLKALELFEKSIQAKTVGWKIFLNSDEEIGSPESAPFIEMCAEKCHLACFFEPVLEDGCLVSKRKGSSNYHIVSKGKKAHAGRNPEDGKNAIYPLARMILDLEHFATSQKSLINVGMIKGGTAPNIIPDFAEGYINVRSEDMQSMIQIEKYLQISAALHNVFCEKTTFRPPKLFNEKTQSIFQHFKECASQMGIKVNWKESGGVCDGNITAAKGIVTIDTLGVRGGNIHTENEYLYLPSLYEKTKLTELFLQKIASGKIIINKSHLID